MQLKPLDKGGPTPLHWQLREQLKRAIEQGRLRPGERLPTEQELCQMLGISRSPVRHALRELEREGWILRLQGRGTFVRGEPSSPPVDVLLGGARWQEPLEEGAARAGIPLSVTLEPIATLRRRLVGLVARGRAPDVAVVDSVWVPELAQLEFLLPLEELNRAWVEALHEDFFPSLLRSNTLAGRLYGVPVEADVSLLWYRRDWLEAEGLEAPRTWEELEAVCAHLRRVGKRYGLTSAPLALPAGRKAGETTSYLFLSLLWSCGGEIRIEPEGVRLLQADRVLEFLARLIAADLLDRNAPRFHWRQAAQRLARGEAALALGGSYEKAFIQRCSGWDEEAFQDRVGFTAIPPPAGGTPVPVSGGMSYVITRQARVPQRALQLVREASAPEVMADFCLRTGQNAPRLSVSRRLASDGDRFLQETDRLLATARSRPALPVYPYVSEVLQRLIELVLSEALPPAEAIARAEYALHTLMVKT